VLWTTALTVTRPDGSGDPYEAATTTTVTTGLSAHVSAPSGADLHVGGAQQTITAVALCEPAPALQRGDLVTDPATGSTFAVAWVLQRVGLGLDHQKAGLSATAGAANG